MQNFISALLMVQYSYRQAILKKMKDSGIDLSFEMLLVIKHLYLKENINQQELGNQIFKDKSSLSYLLGNMEKRNLIQRVEYKNDKRNKLITLSEEGRLIFTKIKSELDLLYKKIDLAFDAEKMNLCIDNMKELSIIINNE